MLFERDQKKPIFEHVHLPTLDRLYKVLYTFPNVINLRQLTFLLEAIHFDG